jgi:hypothetical protein
MTPGAIVQNPSFLLTVRAEEIAARVRALKKLPPGIRLVYAEKTIDEVVALLVEIAAVSESSEKRIATLEARFTEWLKN